MSNKILTSAVLAASITGFASAGVLTMTADSTTGVDAWAGLSGYKMVLTINCSTMNDAGSSSFFTLNSWTFEAMDADGATKFKATGSNSLITPSPVGGKFVATIGLTASNIDINELVPAVQEIAFTYAFSNTESLMAAIDASANTSNGVLQLGTDINPTGLLTGQYAVPAPGAAALLGLGGLISRRRKA